jgi:hypothetical protein
VLTAWVWANSVSDHKTTNKTLSTSMALPCNVRAVGSKRCSQTHLRPTPKKSSQPKSTTIDSSTLPSPNKCPYSPKNTTRKSAQPESIQLIPRRSHPHCIQTVANRLNQNRPTNPPSSAFANKSTTQFRTALATVSTANSTGSKTI